MSWADGVVLLVGPVVGALLALTVVLQRRWTWWKSLLCVVVSALISPAAIVIAQVGPAGRPVAISWFGRFVVGVAVFFGMTQVADSGFVQRNPVYRGLCVLTTYSLSSTATTHTGTVVRSDRDTHIEIVTGFRQPFVLAGFGVALGMLFFRHPMLAGAGLAAVGWLLGLIAGAMNAAWLLDHGSENYAEVVRLQTVLPPIALIAFAGCVAILVSAYAKDTHAHDTQEHENSAEK